jgi:hypothetical protein
MLLDTNSSHALCTFIDSYKGSKIIGKTLFDNEW